MEKSSSSSDLGDIPESNQNPSEYYLTYKFSSHETENYEIESKVGRGRYSDVYEGTDLRTSNKVVIKILKPTSIIKIKREIYFLEIFKECPNIVQITDVVKESNSDIYCLIFKSISGQELKKCGKGINPEDLQLYMYKILKCLEYCHEKGVIHRDIKACNIVINPQTKELNVVDWGLAEHYIKDYKYSLTVGSRYYKSPELLFEYKKYDYGIDMWGLGCIFGALLFQIDFLFKGESAQDQIVKVAEVIGFEEINKYLSKYKGNCFLNSKTKKKISECHKKKWEDFINDTNKYLINNEALDLLGKLLQIDHEKRISAKDALNHPYFNYLKSK